ncbi:hypothetical protein F5X68DRAFT_242891 [Plectosphaerella plurivora]|uniref:Nuclear GTPase SLIP-GC n=1 Tax=Plectosphaerella plurivora TaxID=936078 RepID=A0A9P8V7G9_9PEZI|nr:hypothetical protein F5X68DRAFT_242891 [Plectosphaerella plurivora]
MTNTRALARRLADVLGSGRLHLDQDADMYRLKKEAEELARFEIAATRTVGLVGDSGVGKSSLINSLLDYESLARTSNAGGACTCVATEYIYHDRDDFVIEVELFTREEVKTQMTDLLLAYRQNQSNEQVEGRDELKKKAALADSTFRTMFNGRASREFLCAAESEQVLAQLHQWADEAYPAELGGRGASFASARACSDELEKVSSGNKDGKWPFIRRVRVFLRSHVLRNGLKLVDLPGLRDVNVARIAVTERELQKCDEVFAVARIGRAKTDEGIVSVFDLSKRVHLTNVGIICTASDEEEAHEAEKDRAGHERTEMRRLRERADDLKQQKRQAKEDLKQLEEGDEAHQMLYRQYRGLKDQHKEVDGALKKYMIETRNMEVTRSLMETFRDRANGNVRIFCVSSKMYREHRQDPLPQPGRLNWLSLSGIIALRRHCLGLTADRQLQALTTYVGSAVPGLLSNLGLWAAAGEDGGEGRAAVREALDKVEKKFRKALRGGDSPLVWVHTTISDSFADKIYQDQDGKIGAWSKAAIEACRDWRTVHFATFAAFCRRRGVHKPPSAEEKHNWNQEAIQAVADEVDLAWDDWIRELRRDILHRLVKRLQVAGNLRDTPLVPLLEGTTRLQDLVTATSARQEEAEHEIKQIWGEFAQGLRELHNHAFTGIASSMMAAALEQTYFDCLQIDGKQRL